jgi:hypothetical protein
VAPILRAVVVAVVLLAVVAVHRADKPADATVPAVGDGTPRYWKGNLHTHSLWSDGNDFPEMIADWYKRHGYQFLALTEHNVLADGEKWVDAAANAGRKEAVAKYAARFGAGWVERRAADGKEQVRLKPQAEYRSLLDEAGKFLMIPAEEITHQYAKAPVHINAINVRDKVTPIDGGSVAETIRVNLGAAADQRKRTGWRSVAFLNHPNFRWGVRGEDMVAADALRFFEVFNGHPGVNNYGDDTHASCERLWDVVNAVRVGKLGLPPVLGLGTDDAHDYLAWGAGKTNPGRGWVMARAPHLTAEAIVAALEAGDFYASSGVTLDDVRVEAGELRLTIRGEPGVTYRTEFVATRKGAKLDGEPRLDKDGQPLNVTRNYSDDIGTVVGRATALRPAYRFAGDELYVRAKVTSSRPHPNPYRAGDTECAWVQPVRP